MDIPAAGKLIPRGHGAKECLSVTTNVPPTPESINKFRFQTYPGPGEKRIFHSFFNDSDNSDVCHGVSSKASENAQSMINPPVQTTFQQRMQDLKDLIYASKQKGPLGRSHDQTAGLPKGVDPRQTRFGLKVQKDELASNLISPPKPTAQVELESKLGVELYRISHGYRDVGETVDRNYDWSNFTRDSLYGVPTPHDNSGSGVKIALNCDSRERLSSKCLDDFREHTQPQIGKVHDPIADTLHVTDDHVFGISVLPDQYSAGDLLHTAGQSVFLQCSSFNNGLLVVMRQHLKENNFTNFHGLDDALSQVKVVAEGIVDASIIRDTLYHFNVPLEPDMIELLLAWSSDELGVAYRDLVALMNWSQPISAEVIERVATRTAALQNKTLLHNDYRTSSEQAKATVGTFHTANYRTFGVPTVRTDRPAPRIRRVSDHTNYGDESDAFGLLYPSIYSAHGLYEQDFFVPRPPIEIRQIFTNAGINISDDAFEKLWKEAVERHPLGQVSVESFRAVLENIQTNDKKD